MIQRLQLAESPHWSYGLRLERLSGPRRRSVRDRFCDFCRLAVLEHSGKLPVFVESLRAPLYKQPDLPWLQGFLSRRTESRPWGRREGGEFWQTQEKAFLC